MVVVFCLFRSGVREGWHAKKRPLFMGKIEKIKIYPDILAQFPPRWRILVRSSGHVF